MEKSEREGGSTPTKDGRFSFRVLVGAVLILLVFILWVTLPERGRSATLLATGAAFGGIIFFSRRYAITVREIAPFVLGVAVALLPVVGKGALLVLVLFLLLVSLRTLFIPLWCRALFLVLTASFLGTLFCDLDLRVVSDVVLGRDGPQSSAPLWGLPSWLRSGSVPWIGGVREWGRVLTFFLLLGLFGTSWSRDKFYSGLLVSSLCAWPLIAWQLTAKPMGVFPNYTSFWALTGRWPGTFSDPNAFGIASFLLGALFVARACSDATTHRSWWFTGALLWIVCGFFSGSRSFLLGLVVMAITLWWGTGRGLIVRSGILLLGALAVINSLSLLAPSLFVAVQDHLPLGVSRGIASLEFSHMSDALYSRTIFWRAGCAMIYTHPFFGVGFHSFERALPDAMTVLGASMGGWSDNPNNLYLGIIAELGIFGLLALVEAFRSARLVEGSTMERYIVRAAGVTFLLLLLIGPHIDFDEVSVLGAFLLSMAILDRRPATGVSPAFGVLVGLVVMFGVFVERLHGEWGWYGTGNGERWSSGSAQGIIPCPPSGRSSVSVRALHPDIASRPVTVRVKSEGSYGSEQTLQSTESVDFPLSCAPHLSGEPERELRFRVEVSRVFRPSLYGMNRDQRVLGVQVRKTGSDE